MVSDKSRAFEWTVVSCQWTAKTENYFLKKLKTKTTNKARAEAACGLCRARRSSFYEVKKN